MARKTRIEYEGAFYHVIMDLADVGSNVALQVKIKTGYPRELNCISFI
jgi:hypothetical protein